MLCSYNQVIHIMLILKLCFSYEESRLINIVGFIFNKALMFALILGLSYF